VLDPFPGESVAVEGGEGGFGRAVALEMEGRWVEECEEVVETPAEFHGRSRR